MVNIQLSSIAKRRMTNYTSIKILIGYYLHKVACVDALAQDGLWSIHHLVATDAEVHPHIVVAHAHLPVWEAHVLCARLRAGTAMCIEITFGWANQSDTTLNTA